MQRTRHRLFELNNLTPTSHSYGFIELKNKNLRQHLVLTQTDQSDQKDHNALYMVIHLIRLISLSQN
jgi:hypothetical protein